MNQTQAEPPDDELIRIIRKRETDVSAAKRAFTVFYDRHAQFLYRCVRNADQRLVGYGLGTADIVEETFEKVWLGAAKSYSLPLGLSPEEAARRTKQWLASIAHNLVKDKLRSRKYSLPIDPGENEQLFTGDPNLVVPHLNLIELVATTLSVRDAAIVWFKVGHYDAETRRSQPPPEELEVFCRDWNLTPATLRKAYERALATLRLAFSPSSISQE